MKKLIGGIVSIIITLGLLVLIIGGYLRNFVKFVQLDFKQPVKAEVLRGVGVLVPPAGVVMGWVNIKD